MFNSERREISCAGTENSSRWINGPGKDINATVYETNILGLNISRRVVCPQAEVKDGWVGCKLSMLEGKSKPCMQRYPY